MSSFKQIKIDLLFDFHDASWVNKNSRQLPSALYLQSTFADIQFLIWIPQPRGKVSAAVFFILGWVTLLGQLKWSDQIGASVGTFSQPPSPSWVAPAVTCRWRYKAKLLPKLWYIDPGRCMSALCAGETVNIFSWWKSSQAFPTGTPWAWNDSLKFVLAFYKGCGNDSSQAVEREMNSLFWRNAFWCLLASISSMLAPLQSRLWS